MYKEVYMIGEDIKTIYGILYVANNNINAGDNLKDEQESKRLNSLITDSYNMLVMSFTELLSVVNVCNIQPKVLDNLKDISKEINNNKINKKDVHSLAKSGMSISGCLLNTIIANIVHGNVEHLSTLYKRLAVRHELLKYDLSHFLNESIALV